MIDKAIVASTGDGLRVRRPSALLASVKLCAAVNAVIVHTSRRSNPSTTQA
jgi:hypothetical protein